MTQNLKQTERVLGELAGDLYATTNILLAELAAGDRELAPDVLQMEASADIVGIFAIAVSRELKGR